MSDLKLEQLLRELLKLKDKTADNKALLKNYKIKSPKLSELETAKKGLLEQITDEKDRIEAEMMEDLDFAGAKKDEKTLKIGIKEKNSEIREVLLERQMNGLTEKLEFVIDGEPVKIEVEKFRKFFLNGKEEK